MKNKNSKKIVACSLLAMVFVLFGIVNTDASAIDYTIQIKNSLTGDNISNHQFEFELRDAITDRLLQTKRSNEETIAFDPIQADFSRAQAGIDFYKVVEKNLGEDGMTYDEQVAYIGLHGDGKVAYQKDNTYKYVSKDGKPHPFHATEEELEGGAYMMFDRSTGVLTYFRDEIEKYACESVRYGDYYGCKGDANRVYVPVREKASEATSSARPYLEQPYYVSSTDNEGRITDFNLREEVREVIFKDAIRPEAAINDWFKYWENVEKMDLSKFDTSRVTDFGYSFYGMKKLKEANITTLDFSGIDANGSISHMFEGSQLQEFDSRNFDLSKLSGRPASGGFFSLSNVRYINLENWTTKSSSQEFGNNKCIEKIVFGNTEYKPTATSFHLGRTTKMLKVETGQIVDVSYGGLYDYIEDGLSLAGTYVGPICNVTPVTFDNSYIKPETPKTVTTKKESVKNPDTATSTPAIYFMLFGALAAGTTLVVHKISRSTKHI